MRSRPVTLTLTGWLFVLTGFTGLVVAAYRLVDPATRNAAPTGAHHLRDFAWAAASGIVAAVGGALVLRGRGWGRWALIVWMAGHLVLASAHSGWQLAFHAAIFVPLTFFLFRGGAATHFRGAVPGDPPVVGDRASTGP